MVGLLFRRDLPDKGRRFGWSQDQCQLNWIEMEKKLPETVKAQIRRTSFPFLKITQVTLLLKDRLSTDAVWTLRESINGCLKGVKIAGLDPKIELFVVADRPQWQKERYAVVMNAKDALEE